jgi:hypothetical protein
MAQDRDKWTALLNAVMLSRDRYQIHRVVWLVS